MLTARYQSSMLEINILPESSIATVNPKFPAISGLKSIVNADEIAH
jgi:hypothetical protein